MRGLMPGAASPHPLADLLPGLYQDDPMIRQWTAAFDEVLAPVFVALDTFPHHLDPWLAPEDFLPWLAGWMGLVLDPSWPAGRRRAAVADAAELYRRRGTRAGIAAAVRSATGVQPVVRDSGGATWSTASGSGPQGEPGSWVEVELPVGPGTSPQAAAGLRAAALRAATQATPAHMIVRVVDLAADDGEPVPHDRKEPTR